MTCLAHGATGGEPCNLREAVVRVNAAIRSLRIGEPVIVGHSISSGIASIYAASYPVRGSVTVDGTVDIQPMAELIRRLEPILRSDRFADAFAPFQQSMGFEHVPEPLRTHALQSQDIRQEVVLRLLGAAVSTMTRVSCSKKSRQRWRASTLRASACSDTN